MNAAEKILKKKTVYKTEMDKIMPRKQRKRLWKKAALKLDSIMNHESSKAGAHCHKVHAGGFTDHIQLNELPYCKPVKKWLIDRYGKEANQIWKETARNYNEYLSEIPDYGGKKNGHARAIYGGLLIFALYPALPDQPPITELQDFVQNMFMGPFTTLGRVFNLNRSFDMWLIDKVFRKTGNRDRKDIKRYPDGFINIDEPYDREHHAARYSFKQCPNAEFAREHDLLHVLPLLCNSDFFGIHEIHGRLIRCGTCGNSEKCDYLIVGNRNELAAEYETVTDAQGFLISRKRKDDKS